MKNIKIQTAQGTGVQGGPGGGPPALAVPDGVKEGGFQQDGGFADLMQRIMNAEKRIQDCCESIDRNEGALKDKVNFAQTACT